MKYKLIFGEVVIPEDEWDNYLTDWEVELGKQKIREGENPAELKELFGCVIKMTLN